MSEAVANSRPIIIKRKKVSGGDGHHGGAWKVAYADFVTAMMAFFMLMWLLNATSEQQRAGLADYFTPTVTINRNPGGGGDGMFGGDSVSSEEMLTQMGEGSSQQHEGSQVNAANEPDEALKDAGDDPTDVQALKNLEEVLMAKGGESIHSDLALRHITSKLTDEGLVIEFYDLPDASLFEPGTDTPMPVAYQVADLLAEYIPNVENPIAIRGHVRTQPIVVRESNVWELSTSRATKIRELLEDGGFDPMRVMQTAGEADRDPAIPELTDVRNNRIEVIVLRTDR